MLAAGLTSEQTRQGGVRALSGRPAGQMMAEAQKADATVLKPAGALPWGGYGGTFADPEGYIWSFGYSAQGTDRPYGSASTCAPSRAP